MNWHCSFSFSTPWILNFSHEFQLKELEKLGPKKGIISQTVKDVVQSLVDDDLVSKDKIGTSVSKLVHMELET